MILATVTIKLQICPGQICYADRILTSSVLASVIVVMSLAGSWMCLLRPPSTSGRTLQKTLMLPCVTRVTDKLVLLGREKRI